MINIIKLFIDVIIVILTLLFIKDLRSISDFIPTIHLPIYNISLSDYYHFIIASIFIILWRGLRYDLYNFKPFLYLHYEILAVFKLVTSWLVIIIAYLYFTQNFLYNVPIPRLIIIYSYFSILFFLIIYRVLLWFILNKFKISIYPKVNILFIGANNLSNTVYNIIKKNKMFNIIGAIDFNIYSTKKNELKIIGKIDDLEKIIDKYNVNEIIFTIKDASEELKSQIIDICQIKHIKFKFIPDILNIYSKNIEIISIAGIPIISLKNTSLEGWNLIIKTIFDKIVSFILIILLAPIFIIIAIAIKLDSKGPIFFAYDDNGNPMMRVGRHKKPFHYFKFRSMYDKVHGQEKFLKNERSDGPLFKIKNDPRVTRVGKFLRKFHLDELPELFLVLKGDMSLVGPRPHWVSEVEKYKKHYNKVFEIKPGITGLSQIISYGDKSGTYEMPFEEEVKIDIQYMQNWSLLLDIYILIKTFFIVISKIFNKKNY